MNTELSIPIDDFNCEKFRFYFDENRKTLYLDFYDGITVIQKDTDGNVINTMTD